MMTTDQKYARAKELRQRAAELRMGAREADRKALILESEADQERLGPYDGDPRIREYLRETYDDSTAK